jgi:glycosyltransferase involved in cell wall biosynthesis
MAALDILVLSSLWEGLPCVFAQAQACGLPVVATDVAGAREAIEPGKTGILVPPKNPQAMGREIVNILKSESIRRNMGRAALNSTRKFGLDIMLDRHDELYRECLQ